MISSPTASIETPVKLAAERKQSIDIATVQVLEKNLAHRPEKKDLIDRNILKAAKEKLQRSQLEDKLEHALQARPKPEELVKEGILKESEAPPA
ncbi:uncharacterized protein BXZ73DRAFT_97720 [Epithele typhae]|uniref:uncharacterized protein n=1 Tax=Epithele typhae TaxID=378194 RepID=UPI0020085628|nr:uncharacterized protein BXZ73DRAFT_97720 [Epithele typhae]KAH9942308.1 hypothetical protein BXZ73DRAFT_97720 [Epithele typhae]